MKKTNGKQVKSYHKALLEEALYVTKSRHNLACDLVQEVWEIALTKKIVGTSRFTLPYLKKILRHKFYDHRKISRPTDLKEQLLDDSMDAPPKYKQEIITQLYQVLKNHKNGWIVLEMQAQNIQHLKTLSQVKRIKYATLRQKYNRLVKDLKSTFREKGYKIRGGDSSMYPLTGRVFSLFCHKLCLKTVIVVTGVLFY